MSKLIIWYNPNTKTYYHKFVRGFYCNYEVGFKNQYNHEIVLVIDKVVKRTIKLPLRNRLIKRLIRFLEKLEK